MECVKCKRKNNWRTQCRLTNKEISSKKAAKKQQKNSIQNKNDNAKKRHRNNIVISVEQV